MKNKDRIADPVIHCKIPIRLYKRLMEKAKEDSRTINGYVRFLITKDLLK